MRNYNFDRAEAIGRTKADRLIRGVKWSNIAYSNYDGENASYLFEVKNRGYSSDQLKQRFGDELMLEVQKLKNLAKWVKAKGKKDALYISFYGLDSYTITLRQLAKLI